MPTMDFLKKSVKRKKCKVCKQEVVIDEFLNKVIKHGDISCNRCKKEWESYMNKKPRGGVVIKNNKQYIKICLKNI